MSFDSLVPALRGHAKWVRNFAASPGTYIRPSCSAETFDAAADEIERLRKELARTYAEISSIVGRRQDALNG